MPVPPEQPPVYPPPAGPADQPTAPLDPIPARQAPHRVYREDPYIDPRREAWRWEGLRTALTIVGLLALIAIGLAVWALLRANHDNNGRVVSGAPANTAAVVALNRRVSHLESQLAAIRSAGGNGAGNTQALAARVAGLEQSQKQLAAKIGHAGNSATVSQLASKYSALSAKVSQWVGKEAQLSGQVSGLQGHVAQLAGQVRQLQGQSGSQTSTLGTTTTTGP